MWDATFLALGLVGLCLGASMALSATVAIGERHGLSQMFLGLTVLAIGTDLPEIVIAIDGGLLQLRGIEAGGVVVGNAVGSAVAQAGLVLGIVCLASPVLLPSSHVRRDGGVLVLSIGLLALLAADGIVSRLEGLALATLYAIYLVRLVRGAMTHEQVRGEWSREDGRAAMRAAGGFLVLLLSADVALSRAMALADTWQISPTVVGALLIGPGTSLPELALSFAAIARGKTVLSVGNVIGSNILDVLLPVGLCAAIAPVRVDREVLLLDLPTVFALSALVFLWARTGRSVGRSRGALLIGAYALYALIRLNA